MGLITYLERVRVSNWVRSALLIAAVTPFVAIGHPGAPASASAGQVEVTASDATPSGAFGASVAISGSSVAIGAPSQTQSGAVYIFKRTHGGAWQQSAEVTPPDGQTDDAFGASVSFVGKTLVVGAPRHASSSGTVYIFGLSHGRWTLVQELSPTNPRPGLSTFGFSVSLSGKNLAIGRQGGSGDAYIFTHDHGRWLQAVELTVSPYDTSFGNAVALSGSTLAVSGNLDGNQYLFGRASSSWTQSSVLGLGDSDSPQGIALAGTTLVIGVPYPDSTHGVVDVEVANGSTWTHQQTLVAPDAATEDEFGYSVALSGSLVLVGARGQDSFNGAAYMFERLGTQWSELHEFSDVGGNAVAIVQKGRGHFLAVVGDPATNSAAGSAWIISG